MNTQSPRYLVDTRESLALPHGGSIFVGGTEDVQRYWDYYGSRSLPDPTSFATQEDFYDSFITPLRMYTGGGVANYGTNIVNTYQFDYLPLQLGTIFH